jgi:hypothetical protein
LLCLFSSFSITPLFIQFISSSKNSLFFITFFSTRNAQCGIKDTAGVVRDVLENDEKKKKAIEVCETVDELLEPFLQIITKCFENVSEEIAGQLLLYLSVFTIQIAQREIELLTGIIN